MRFTKDQVLSPRLENTADLINMHELTPPHASTPARTHFLTHARTPAGKLAMHTHSLLLCHACSSCISRLALFIFFPSFFHDIFLPFFIRFSFFSCWFISSCVFFFPFSLFIFPIILFISPYFPSPPLLFLCLSLFHPFFIDLFLLFISLSLSPFPFSYLSELSSLFSLRPSTSE